MFVTVAPHSNRKRNQDKVGYMSLSPEVMGSKRVQKRGACVSQFLPHLQREREGLGQTGAGDSRSVNPKETKSTVSAQRC